jgi:transcriptional regulator with XRE-family HTH domain
MKTHTLDLETDRAGCGATTPDLEALGTFIRDRRHRLRLTQTQLANRVGWVQEKISILEWGKYGTPSLPALARLGTALETSLPALLLAAGYAEVGLPAVGQAEGRQPGTDTRQMLDDAGEQDSRDDTVETSGLSALLAAEPDMTHLELALRCKSHRYHATIQAAGSEWLLTLADDERATMPAMIGDVLVTREGGIVTAILEVLRANQPSHLQHEGDAVLGPSHDENSRPCDTTRPPPLPPSELPTRRTSDQ